MKPITSQLKQAFHPIDSIEERLQLLKNKYKDETAYVVTCGPSLSKHDLNILKSKLKNKLVICIKQAQNVLEEETDFHLLNTYNLSQYNWNPNTIVYWSLSKSYANEQLQRIINTGSNIDLYIPVINPPFIDYSQTIQSTCNFEDFHMMETHTEVKLGVGMMYEMAIPLILLLGCKKVISIGWDLGDPQTSTKKWDHFYKNEVNKVTKPMNGEIKEKLKSTEKLYDWFISKGIDFKIISDKSFVSPKFPRITLNDIK
ncbi:hypothetical protein OAA40_00040 [bacterium]|nr:hypothetical protein [bacterium]